MKTGVWITFRAEDIPGEAAAILAPSGCGPDVAEVLAGALFGKRKVRVDVKLDETDERVAKVYALLKQYGIEPDVSGFIEYSDDDLQNARLLWLGSSSFDDQVHANPSLGTKYDMTHACPHCGTGAKQVSPLYVDHTYMAKIRKHRAISTMNGDVLVDGGMVKKLKDAGITGISFGDVRARLKDDKWTSVARDQILIEHTMPPMRGELTEKDIEHLCKVCRRGGFMSYGNKTYREEDLVGLKDFNLTWEWFGVFRTAEDRFGAHRSNPSVLVTPKVMNIFRDAGVKTLGWRPVDIET